MPDGVLTVGDGDGKPVYAGGVQKNRQGKKKVASVEKSLLLCEKDLRKNTAYDCILYFRR